MKTELEKFSDQMALMEMCVQLEDEQKKIFDALPKLKDEFSKEAKAEFARLTKQAEAIEWKLAEARGEYLKTVEANRAEFARMEQSIKAKGSELAEYSKRLQSEVPAPVEQKIKAIFETLPRPANGKDGADGKDASLLTGFRGNWDADTTYKPGDWFTFRGSSYLVLRACKGQIPTKNAQGEPNAYYAVFAMSGAPGIVPQGLYLSLSGGTVNGAVSQNLNSSLSTAWFAGPLVTGADATNTAHQIDTYGAQARYDFRRANGTKASPTKLVNGNTIGGLACRGYDGSDYTGTVGSLLFTVNNDWSGSNLGVVASLSIVFPNTLTQTTAFSAGGNCALAVAAGTTAYSSLRVPHGAAPTSPVNGDIWTTTAGLFVQINGVTVGPLT